MSLANVSVSAIPPVGTYVIYNRVLSPTGQKLAISFNGQGVDAVVKPLAYTKDQLWRLSTFDPTHQILSPSNNSALAAAWGTDEAVVVLPGGTYVWTFQSSNAGVTIRDGAAQTAAWALNNQTNNSVVSIVQTNESAIQQKWILELQK